MAVLHQAGAVRFYNFDNELCLTRSETLSQTSISAGERVDLTIDVFSIGGFGFFKIIFLAVWFLPLLINDDYISSHPVCCSVKPCSLLGCELLNKGSAVSLSIWWLRPLLNSDSLTNDLGVLIAKYPEQISVSGNCEPSQVTFAYIPQELTGADSCYFCLTSLPKKHHPRVKNFLLWTYTLPGNLRARIQPVLLETECSQSLALEHVFSHSLGWKGDANIPSCLIASNLAQVREGQVKPGVSRQHLPRKTHVGELESRRHSLKQYYNFGRYHGSSSAQWKKHLLLCKSSEVIPLGIPHLYMNRREFSWGNIARWFFLVDFFLF